MGDIDKLQKDIIEFRDERDWKQFHNPKDLALSISLESAELLECFQWKNNEECKEYVISHKNHVAEEMSDILNYLLIMSHDLDIDIIDACAKKLKSNNEKYSVNKSKGNHKKYTEF